MATDTSDNRRQSGLWQQSNDGYFERQPQQAPYAYYQPPPRKSHDDNGGRRYFSERTNPSNIPGYGEPFSSNNAPVRSDSRKIRDLTRAASEKVTNPPPDPNYVPNNVRSKPWSPDPATMDKPRQQSNASDIQRRGSVPDRSPLQRLEMSAKEEKRARLEEAVMRSRQKSVGHGKGPMPAQGDMLSAGTMRNDKRAVSDGSRMPRDNRHSYKQNPRQMPLDQFQQASDAMRYRPSQPTAQEPYISKQRQQSVPQEPYMPKERHQSIPQPQPQAAQPPRRPMADSPSLNAGPYASASAPRQDQTQFASEPQFYQGQPQNTRNPSAGQYPDMSASDQGRGDMQRTASGRYKHRLRDAGFAGAGAAAAGTAAYNASSGNRDKTPYDRQAQADASPVSPRDGDGSLGRSGSRKLQKRNTNDMDPKRGKQSLQTDRMGTLGSKKERKVAESYLEPDPLPKEQVANGPNERVPYKLPPQTAAGQQAHAFVNETGQRDPDATSPMQPPASEKHHHFGGMFHGHDKPQRGYVPSGQPLEEWRNAEVARLSVSDLEFDMDATAGGASNGKDPWWERDQSRRTSSSGRDAQPAQMDGPYEEEAKQFRPMIFLKCGPLLRYTGLRKEAGGREIWRGSIMVVTEDGQSDYSSTPNLRIFGQHSDLHQPPSRELLQSGQATPSQLRDPVAGQVKISRTGRPLYVRPAHELDGEVDLSREENNGGLFAATRTPTLGLSYSAGADGRQSPHISWQGNSRIKRNDGERARRHKDVKAARLHTERGFTFWRWNIEIELGSTQHRVAYRINKGPAIGFWVPARGETMHIMFHSCNGFSLAVDPSQFSGPDPLWRNVLNRHQSRPFHVMLGGGDQIYNDAAMRDTELFKDWLQTKNPHEKHGAEFSPEMQDELESFYLHRYAMWFSQGMFAMAGAQIPMVNVWDDHDIIDGFGSYPHHFMSTKVFTGLGAVAFKYYMLFQHQSVVSETTKEEPSWVLGAGPGPYINELSRNIFLNLGRKVAFLGVDCRTERMRDEILSEQSYDILFERCQDEIVKGEVKHLIVLLGVPIAYPRLNFLENILTSRVMDPIKAIGRTGMLGGFVNKFDGGVEILDDLDDHWTAKHHKEERNWFIQELQELAASKSVRVTILGGDVHLGAVGQFYTPKKVGVQKDRDHRYMPNVVSSAIVNTPPPPMMADVLNKRNKVHHLDDETDEDLIPMFEADVDGSKRNNKCLLPRRNYCTIRAFEPGHTPPPTPPPERQSFDQGGERGFEAQGDNRDRRYPPGSMKRTMSLTRGPGSLIRRLSGGGRNKNPPVSLLQEHTRNYNDYGQDGSPAFGTGRSNSLSGPRPESAGTARRASGRPDFMRRPTTLNEKEIKKALAKGGAPDENGEADAAMIGQINLEGGLDICLNMEIDQRDPGGSTMPYRMLVPGLWYEGPGDPNTLSLPKRQKEGGFLQRFKSRRRKSVGSQASSAGSSRSGSPDGRQQQGGAMAPAAGPVLNRAATAPQGTNKLQKQDYGNDGAEDSPRNGSSGRGGFLQRFRSQRRRSMSSERSYSRSPSPEPQQQQQQYPGPEPQSPSAIPGIGGPRKLQKNNDYAPPNGGTDRSRSGGFLQRFRSRRNRSPESYSGSSARSASPEPQQQQAPVAAQGGPGWVPTATGGVRMPIAERRSMDQGQSNARSAAYDRGMQGSGPPVGGDRRAQSMSLGSRGMGTRFYSAGGGRDDWREGDGVEDEFFDPGEEGRGVPPQRQGSKAERMLGMYDGAGEGQGEMTEGRGGKKKWMAWR